MTFLEGMIVLWSLIFAAYLIVDRVCRCAEKSAICKTYEECVKNGGEEDGEKRETSKLR